MSAGIAEVTTPHVQQEEFPLIIQIYVSILTLDELGDRAHPED